MFKKFMLAPVAAAVLSACAVGPNYHAPETPSAEQFDGIEATYSTAGRAWRISGGNFDDATLERLVTEAAKSNYDVRIALSRVAEARALRRDTAFDLAPSINAGGGYTKTKFAAGPGHRRHAARTASSTTRASTRSGNSTSSAASAAASRPATRSSAPSRRPSAMRRSS